MRRLVSNDSRVEVERAKSKLLEDARHCGGAILIYDTFVTLGTWRTDAIMIEALTPEERLVVAVPYKAKKFLRRFRVYKPKFLECPKAEVESVAQKFWDGVGSHENGNKVWTNHIDQSR